MTEFVLYAPITKVDKEKRTVAGWATTEDLDKQNEIVDYSASKNAFSNWQGNIREMHEPRAVGKAVNIAPDDDTKKVWVEAYISKGAEDTWQKVTDGTLRGFSIGGQTVEKRNEIVKDLDTGGSRSVTRITKYKLNELSLVDNPANASCSFTLVKNVDGVPYQTEIVEDIKKIIITEADDPLKHEIKEHRDKADSLIKKVLERDDLDKLSDDDFGVVRKTFKDGIITKERFIPMPDKVHSVRALEILDKYSLSNEEKLAVHKKAQGILGSAYDTYKNINRGGIDDVEKFQELIDKVSKLEEKLELFVKAWEGAYRPIPGSKEVPSQKTSDPNLGESAPLQSGAADGVQTQHPEGSYPTKESEPEKAVKAEDVEKAKNPATSSLETQESPAAPVKKDAKDSEGSKYPGKHPATLSGPHTQPEEGAYPAKGPIKAAVEYAEGSPEEEAKETAAEESAEDKDKKKKKEVKKVDGQSEDSLAKLEGVVESLSKRFVEFEKALRQPKPRKFVVEKTEGSSTNEEEELSKLEKQVHEWNLSGAPETPERRAVRDAVLNKRLNKKFR